MYPYKRNNKGELHNHVRFFLKCDQPYRRNIRRGAGQCKLRFMSESIKPIDGHSIASGQVVIDLQTAVKELVENNLDASATSVSSFTSLRRGQPNQTRHTDVRFQNYGLKSIEVVDNGTGITPKDHDSIGQSDGPSTPLLCSSSIHSAQVLTFGFCREALSSLCALTDGFTVTTANCSEAPMGTAIEIDRNGNLRSKCKIARQVWYPFLCLQNRPLTHMSERNNCLGFEPVPPTPNPSK